MLVTYYPRIRYIHTHFICTFLRLVTTVIQWSSMAVLMKLSYFNNLALDRGGP